MAANGRQWPPMAANGRLMGARSLPLAVLIQATAIW
jgi:hypothetical protein